MEEAIVDDLIDEAAHDVQDPEKDQASDYPQDGRHCQVIAQPEPSLALLVNVNQASVQYVAVCELDVQLVTMTGMLHASVSSKPSSTCKFSIYVELPACRWTRRWEGIIPSFMSLRSFPHLIPLIRE